MKKEYVKTARLGVGKTTARAVTGTESVGIGAPSRQVWDRAKKLTAIMLSALLIASMLSVPLLSLTAKPAHAAPGDWVAAGMPRELGEVYAKYHTVQDSDMPPSYNEYAAEYFNMLYYSTLDNHTIYCIEIFEHAYIAHPMSLQRRRKVFPARPNRSSLPICSQTESAFIVPPKKALSSRPQLRLPYGCSLTISRTTQKSSTSSAALKPEVSQTRRCLRPL